MKNTSTFEVVIGKAQQTKTEEGKHDVCKKVWKSLYQNGFRDYQFKEIMSGYNLSISETVIACSMLKALEEGQDGLSKAYMYKNGWLRPLEPKSMYELEYRTAQKIVRAADEIRKERKKENDGRSEEDAHGISEKVAGSQSA